MSGNPGGSQHITGGAAILFAFAVDRRSSISQNASSRANGAGIAAWLSTSVS